MLKPESVACSPLDNVAPPPPLETKQRRVNGAVGSHAVQAIDLEEGCDGCDGHDKAKARSSSTAASLRRALATVLRMLQRRMVDFATTCGLWVSWVLGYIYMTEVLLQPRGGWVVEIMSVVDHTVFFLAILSWFSVIFYGPGRVPPEDEGNSQMPEPLVRAMAVGKFNQHKPFDGKDGWCKTCAYWKPAMASHCAVCNTCTLWMDHHCNFASTCIGFRNFRCFMLMLAYTELLAFCCVPALLWRLLLDPYAFLDAWELGYVLLFCAGWAGFVKISRGHLTSAVGKIQAGWPSWVLLTKFQSLANYADNVLGKRRQEIKECGPHGPSLDGLQSAMKGVRKDGPTGLRGILAAKDNWRLNFIAVFGEKPGWHWLLPLRPGGSGNPLRPSVYDESACEAWIALGEAIEPHQEALLQKDRDRRESKERRQMIRSEQVNKWLAAAEAKLSEERT